MRVFDKTYKTVLFCIALFYIAIPFISSIPPVAIVIFLTEYGKYGIPFFALLFYFLFHLIAKPNGDVYKCAAHVNVIALTALSVVFTVFMFFADGNVTGSLMSYFNLFILQFSPGLFILNIMDVPELAFLSVFATYLIGFVFCTIASRKLNIKRIIIPAICVAFCLCSSVCLYLNRPEIKYGGHGFKYMNGYSSTDFEDYTVYSESSKLVSLNHESPLIIENESDMPVLDGAEACYPLYSAFAKAVYKDIDKIEKSALENEDYKNTNGRIVSFTNTIYGFNRLVDKEADMFFGAKPSREQLEYAKENGVELEIKPIGREGFVFFVEEDNPINGLTSEQLRKIYRGDIENWKELGGKNQKIIAFQRPENSGSQTMMTYFMNGAKLKEPMKYEKVDGMAGVITEVAEYNNEAGAIGYTFRYFLEGLNQEKGVKMLSVDGVYPTVENIEDGSYPLTVPLCLVTRKHDNAPYVQKMKEFILSKDGQYIIRKTGYAGLR